MTHPSEEELILHFYAETGQAAVELHLRDCDECRLLYGSIERTLKTIDTLPVPEPGAGYEGQVWSRIAPSLQPRGTFRFLTAPWRWAIAGAALAGLLVVAFQMGRRYPPDRDTLAAVSPESRESVLLVAVVDHLERSQMVLTELANAEGSGALDISSEQQRAADLVDENRLYRQTALRSGDTMLAGELEELERVLQDVAHAPSRISAADLDDLRLRLKTEGILFKLRVLYANVRNRQDAPARRPI